MRRRKRTYLNLGGLEAGDGRDLLSSSKHYVFSSRCVFVCVNDDKLKFVEYLYLSFAYDRFGQKEGEREDGT